MWNMAQAQDEANTHRIQMVNTEREVIYSHNPMMDNYDPPTITRWHRGEWRPGVRQFVFGSQAFSSWQSMHGTHTRAPQLDRTNLRRANAKPIRLWDAGTYPASVPPNTYRPNPSQLMAGNVNASGNLATSNY